MVIGITGGVGAGKSTVMEYIKTHYNVYTILADDVARQLQSRGEPVYDAIVSWLGDGVVGCDGQLDRQQIAALVFADEDKRCRLNAIVHPAVRTAILEQIDEQRTRYAQIAVEAALLIEEGYRDLCEELWYVDADLEVRVKRLMESRGYTRQKCLSIIQSQLARADFMRACDRVIVNNGSRKALAEQLDELFIGKRKEGGKEHAGII